MQEQHQHSTGRQPYDGLVGARVGAVSGGVVGLTTAAIVGFSPLWAPMLITAAAGAVIGYMTQKRSG